MEKSALAVEVVGRLQFRFYAVWNPGRYRLYFIRPLKYVGILGLVFLVLGGVSALVQFGASLVPGWLWFLLIVVIALVIAFKLLMFFVRSLGKACRNEPN